MSYWNGSAWVAEDAAPVAPQPSRLGSRIATLVMVVGLLALLVPFQAVGAASRKAADPGCAVSVTQAAPGVQYTLSAWGLPTGTAINLWVTNADGTTGSPLGSTVDGTFAMNESSTVLGTNTYVFTGPTKKNTTVYATCSVLIQ